ncbi:MAG: hypothetical protein L0Y62_05915 [Nitrospirae bacterium]|nr:hypothetical protein [Nitrospirota bacterium]
MRRICLLIAICLLFVSACGKKGDPTLKSFEKPETVKEIKAVQKENSLIMPSKPEGLRLILLDKGVILFWDEDHKKMPSGYRVYRKSASGIEFKLIGETSMPVFTDREPLVQKTIYYITAIGKTKESEPSIYVTAYPPGKKQDKKDTGGKRQ